MAVTSSAYSKSYNSFSGVDIKGVFANKVVAELQAISYSITREKAPIYTMGSADPRSFSRGKRGIAGTLVFIVFDRHVMLSALKGLKFQSDKDDIMPGFQNTKTSLKSELTSISKRSAAASVSDEKGQESNLSHVASDQQVVSPWYTDQIPPFDVTLAAANEYGALAIMSIAGVELLNEGYGVSIDDIVSEQQHTYVARQIIPWEAVSSTAVNEIANQGGTIT